MMRSLSSSYHSEVRGVTRVDRNNREVYRFSPRGASSLCTHVNVTKFVEPNLSVKKNGMITIASQKESPLSPDLEASLLARISNLNFIATYSLPTESIQKVTRCSCLEIITKSFDCNSFIFVKTHAFRLEEADFQNPNSVHGELHAIKYSKSMSVQDIKNHVEECTYVSSDNIRITFNSNTLVASKKLRDVRIQPNDLLLGKCIMRPMSKKGLKEKRRDSKVCIPLLDVQGIASGEYSMISKSASEKKQTSSQSQVVQRGSEALAYKESVTVSKVEADSLHKTPIKGKSSNFSCSPELVHTIPGKLRQYNSLHADGSIPMKPLYTPRELGDDEIANVVDTKGKIAVSIYNWNPCLHVSDESFGTVQSVLNHKDLAYLPPYSAELAQKIIEGSLVKVKIETHGEFSVVEYIRALDDFIHASTSAPIGYLNVCDELAAISQKELVHQVQMAASLVSEVDQTIGLGLTFALVNMNHVYLDGSVFDPTFLLYAIIRAKTEIIAVHVREGKYNFKTEASCIFSLVAHADNFLNVNFALYTILRLCIFATQFDSKILARIFAWRIILFACADASKNSMSKKDVSVVPCVFAMIILQLCKRKEKKCSRENMLESELEEALNVIPFQCAIQGQVTATENVPSVESSFRKFFCQSEEDTPECLKKVPSCAKKPAEVARSAILRLLETLKSSAFLENIQSLMEEYPLTVKAVQVIDAHFKTTNNGSSEEYFAEALQIILESISEDPDRLLTKIMASHYMD